MKGKTVIVKPVSTVCNSRCGYCYNLAVDFRTFRPTPRMSPETVELVQRGLIASGVDRIKLIWHGGEPLLRGLQFYQAIVAQQAALRTEFSKTWLGNGMQSNLTTLTPEWCQFFAANNFVVGSSLDGWEELHNTYRKYPDGRGTFVDAYRGIQMAKEHQILGGVIAVVTGATVKQDPKRFFEYMIGVCPKAEISPCWDFGLGETRPNYTVEPQAFLDFTKQLFDVWWELDDPKRSIRMFHGFMQAMLGGKDFTCSFKGNCGDFLAVEADGSVFPCGKFSGIPEFCLGNVHERGVAEMLEQGMYQEWLGLRRAFPKKCQVCPWVKACNNGCTYERYQGHGNFAELSPFCEVWEGIYAHIDGRIKTLRQAIAQ